MSFTLLSQSHSIARKEHTCDWCGEIINKGEQYYRCAGIYYNEFQYTVMHMECRQASHKHFRDNCGEGEFEPYSFKRGSVEEK